MILCHIKSVAAVLMLMSLFASHCTIRDLTEKLFEALRVIVG